MANDCQYTIYSCGRVFISKSIGEECEKNLTVGLILERTTVTPVFQRHFLPRGILYRFHVPLSFASFGICYSDIYEVYSYLIKLV